jgi:hypothetical protein
MLLSDSVTSTFMTRSPAGLLGSVPTPCPVDPNGEVDLQPVAEEFVNEPTAHTFFT